MGKRMRLQDYPLVGFIARTKALYSFRPHFDFGREVCGVCTYLDREYLYAGRINNIAARGTVRLILRNDLHNNMNV